MNPYWPWLVGIGFLVIYDVVVAMLRAQGATEMQTLSWLYWTLAKERPWVHLITLTAMALLAAHLVFGLWAPEWAAWP
jgi:hypothetical protein